MLLLFWNDKSYTIIIHILALIQNIYQYYASFDLFLTTGVMLHGVGDNIEKVWYVHVLVAVNTCLQSIATTQLGKHSYM